MVLIIIAGLSFALYSQRHFWITKKQKSYRINNVFINSIPKSGSTYLTYALINNYGFNKFKLYSYYDNRDNKFNNNIAVFFNTRGSIAREHMHPPINLTHYDTAVLDISEYLKYSDKIVIHIRDPRQVLYSLINHFNSRRRAKIAANLQTSKVNTHLNLWNTPEDYFTWSQEQQIDWAIEYHLPQIITWINDWVSFKEQQEQNSSGLKVLITTHDELLNDETQLINKILDFYEIHHESTSYEPIAKSDIVRFRRGDPNEWRIVFSTAQQEAINKQISDEFLARFDWVR